MIANFLEKYSSKQRKQIYLLSLALGILFMAGAVYIILGSRGISARENGNDFTNLTSESGSLVGE
jgi:hypothetical protein